MPLGTFDRDDNIARLGSGTFDVLVIGGGITGAGVALDAAARGLRTALVERDDFASGTSSKSSKLVHGGLRYLQNGDVRLVYEALHERQRLLRNAPHLVKVLPFLIPVFTGKGGIIPKQVARALGSAMWMYDLTGGLRIGKIHRRLEADAAREHMPTLGERLAWAYLYYDAQTDDARLTLAARPHRGRRLRRHGREPRRSHPPAQGRRPRHRRRGRHRRRRGRGRAPASVVNATGVWADDVRALDEGTHPDTIRPAKGIHITVPWDKVRNDIAAVVPVPRDRRSVFVVPWPGDDGTVGGPGSVTYIGTTDTDYDGDVDDPQCTAEDVAYLLGAINHSVTEPLDESDVIGTWAGLRPLVSDATSTRTADLSRRHRVTTSDSRPGHRHRRQAHDLPRDGRRRRRRRSPRPSAPTCRGGPVAAAPASCACAAPTAGRPTVATVTSPIGTAARRRCSRRWSWPIRRSANRWCPACPTCGPRPSTRCATRWPRRSTTCSPGAPGPASAAGTPPRPPRPTWPR